MSFLITWPAYKLAQLSYTALSYGVSTCYHHLSQCIRASFPHRDCTLCDQLPKTLTGKAIKQLELQCGETFSEEEIEIIQCTLSLKVFDCCATHSASKTTELITSCVFRFIIRKPTTWDATHSILQKKVHCTRGTANQALRELVMVIKASQTIYYRTYYSTKPQPLNRWVPEDNLPLVNRLLKKDIVYALKTTGLFLKTLYQPTSRTKKNLHLIEDYLAKFRV